MAGGVLSDVYYPTIDNTNVETLRYIVTDGSTFTDVQGRDTTYTVAAISGSGGMGCRVTTSAKSGKCNHHDHITDPQGTPADERFFGETGFWFYLRFDPTVNGNGRGRERRRRLGADRHAHRSPDPGGGRSGTTTNAANRDYAQPVYSRLDAPAIETTNGFAGSASDGLRRARRSHAPRHKQAAANNGTSSRRASPAARRPVTVALGFGLQAHAVHGGVARRRPGALTRSSGWQRTTRPERPKSALPGIQHSGSISSATSTTRRPTS